ncbi:MAG: ammonium transporter [Terricaulis sp.]|nr:ammonium transporter [Terricaulis sp.]
MKFWNTLRLGGAALVAAFALGVAAPELAFAQEAPAEAVVVEEAAPEAAVEVVEEVVEEVAEISAGDTAWMLTSTVLVVLMILPGLALFYGGLAQSKNVLSVIMQVSTVAIIGFITWALWGFSLTFTEGPMNAFIGGFDKFFLAGISMDDPSSVLSNIPEFVFVSFQMTFAAITAALAVGAFAERVKFFPIVIFAILWPLLSYYPLAHMVWGGGMLAEDGALDFAGGTVVHINAGVAGLVGAIFAGHRLGYKKDPLPPHSLVLTYIGAALLWVGWFGFNAGSAGAAGGQAGLATVNTLLATAAAAFSWILTEWVTKGKPSGLGFASGVIAGLVAITPAAGFVGPIGSIVLGLIASPICVIFCAGIKQALNYDDAYDVFGIHGVAGIIGAIGTGILTAPQFGGTAGWGLEDGQTYDIVAQTIIQVKAVVVSIIWVAVATAITFAVMSIFGLKVKKEVEQEGLDYAEHGESAYHS